MPCVFRGATSQHYPYEVNLFQGERPLFRMGGQPFPVMRVNLSVGVSKCFNQ